MTLRTRLIAEAELLDPLNRTDGSFAISIERWRGAWRVDLADYDKPGQQQQGRGLTFADAWLAPLRSKETSR